jgi:hypothetical protein
MKLTKEQSEEIKINNLKAIQQKELQLLNLEKILYEAIPALIMVL